MRETRSSSFPDALVPLRGTETRRNSNPPRLGAILLSESSSHTNQQFIYPGDMGYEDALEAQHLRDEHIPNVNRHVNSQIDLDILIAKAKASHDNSSRVTLMEEGLEILFSQMES